MKKEKDDNKIIVDKDNEIVYGIIEDIHINKVSKEPTTIVKVKFFKDKNYKNPLTIETLQFQETDLSLLEIKYGIYQVVRNYIFKK